MINKRWDDVRTYKIVGECLHQWNVLDLSTG
jgi:hypothetical protein